MKDNRRHFIKKGASLAAAFSLAGLGACNETGQKKSSAGKQAAGEGQEQKKIDWPVRFGEDHPKICVGARPGDRSFMKKIKQIGVDYVLMGGPWVPWTEESLRGIMDPFKEEGLTVINMMIGGFNNVIYGREGRDEEIRKVQDSLVAAGKAGLPIVEYNFYAHRFMDGYYEELARGGAGNTAFDYDRGKDIPHDPREGEAQTADMLWKNITFFLQAVIPVAEKAGVRMALHPNDPPVPVSHGHAQIMATFNDWKRLIEIVDSPSNGMTYDCGVSREIGEDPVEVLRYLGSRDRINHMHYRNVTVDISYLKYQEVFFDEGQVNMFEVMKEVFRLGYKFGIYPEHPRGLDYDKEHQGGIGNQYPGGGGYAAQTYNVAYTKAMMQAVASL
jgi:mannonate dehydratase